MGGDSSGGSVALGLQENHPEVKSRTYNAPVVDLAFRPNANTERFRSFGDPIQMLDTSAHTMMTSEILRSTNFNSSVSEQRQNKKTINYIYV